MHDRPLRRWPGGRFALDAGTVTVEAASRCGISEAMAEIEISPFELPKNGGLVRSFRFVSSIG